MKVELMLAVKPADEKTGAYWVELKLMPEGEIN